MFENALQPNSISSAFGLEEIESINTLPQQQKQKIMSRVPESQDEFIKKTIENKKQDYSKIRDNLLNLLQDMEPVIETAIDEVRSNPSARMLESFSTLVKTFSEINKDLLSLDYKDQNTSQQQNHESIKNNIVFVGTSDSLIDQIKKTL